MEAARRHATAGNFHVPMGVVSGGGLRTQLLECFSSSKLPYGKCGNTVPAEDCACAHFTVRKDFPYGALDGKESLPQTVTCAPCFASRAGPSLNIASKWRRPQSPRRACPRLACVFHHGRTKRRVKFNSPSATWQSGSKYVSPSNRKHNLELN